MNVEKWNVDYFLDRLRSSIFSLSGLSVSKLIIFDVHLVKYELIMLMTVGICVLRVCSYKTQLPVCITLNCCDLQGQDC